MTTKAPRFVDSNVVLYLLSNDERRASRAEAIVADRPVASVQVLNEVASVARRKFDMRWNDLEEFLATLRATIDVRPVTVATHCRGIEIARRLRYGIHDAMIVAAALEAGCGTLWTEDMHGGQRIAGLTLRNPFA